MNRNPVLLLILTILLAVSGRAAAAEDPNPALIYWQAFAVMPELSKEERAHLIETEWRNRTPDSQYASLTAKYDNSFRLLQRAARSRAECDWALDISEGPALLLPHLAKAKALVQAAVARGRHLLQEGKEEQVRDELLSAYTMGRRIAADGILISALVQIAIEQITMEFVAENFYRLKRETLAQVLEGMENAPPRGTVADCMPMEKLAFYHWLLRFIENAQAKHRGNDAAAVEEVRALLASILSHDEANRQKSAAAIVRAAGGTGAGLLQYARELEPVYDELERVMRLPYAEFTAQVGAFEKRIETHSNVLVHEFFPAIVKVRGKEFSAVARLAMLRAAYEHRMGGIERFRKVRDPFGDGPFEVTPFQLDGVERGIKLTSQLKNEGVPEGLIVPLKPGPAFYVQGKKAGQKAP